MRFVVAGETVDIEISQDEGLADQLISHIKTLDTDSSEFELQTAVTEVIFESGTELLNHWEIDRILSGRSVFGYYRRDDFHRLDDLTESVDCIVNRRLSGLGEPAAALQDLKGVAETFAAYAEECTEQGCSFEPRQLQALEKSAARLEAADPEASEVFLKALTGSSQPTHHELADFLKRAATE